MRNINRSANIAGDIVISVTMLFSHIVAFRFSIYALCLLENFFIFNPCIHKNFQQTSEALETSEVFILRSKSHQAQHHLL